MKKFSLVISVVVIALMIAGCAPTTQPSIQDGFFSRMPWISHSGLFVSESSTYKVEKLYLTDQDDASKTELVTDESSFLRYTITRGYDESGATIYTLETDFKIVYTSSEYLESNYRGKTDSIVSTAVFYNDNLSAISTSKRVTLESAPENSYSYEANYSAGTATFTQNGSNRSLTFDKGTYFDNEYLYFIIRALKLSDTATTANFELVNWYECFLSDKFVTFPMTVTLQTADSVPVPEALLSGFSSDGKDSEKHTVNCSPVQIRLNRTESGSPLYAYYTTSPYQITKGDYTCTSDKLLAKVLTFENTLDGKITYRDEYTLIDFKTNELDSSN